MFSSRSGVPATIGVRVCRWGRLCGWSGFFFLAEAPSDDSTVPWWRRGYGSDQLRLCFSACLDHWWLLSVFPGSRVLTLRVMARGVQKRLQSQWFFIVSPPVCCCKVCICWLGLLSQFMVILVLFALGDPTASSQLWVRVR